MKNKLFVVLIVLVLLFVSNNVFAGDLTKTELEFYNENLKIYNNSQMMLETGINFGEMTHSISDNGLELENIFEQKIITSQLVSNIRLNSKYLKEIGLAYETDIKNFDKELDQKYKYSRDNYFMGGVNDSKINEYDKLDISVLFNRDIEDNNIKLLYGIGYEKEDKNYVSEDGKLYINDNGAKSSTNYNDLNYKYESDKPYVFMKVITPSKRKVQGGLTSSFRIYPKITSTNTINIDNNQFESDFEGWGLRYDLMLLHNIKENIMINIGYNYNYKNLDSKNNDSGEDLINYLGIPVNTNDFDLTENVEEGNHKIYASLIFHF